MKREDIPELWGPAEVVEFTRAAVKEKDPGADITDRSVTRWLSLDDFPSPVVTLRMGPVYLADDVKPWVRARLAKSKLVLPGRGRRNAIPEEVKQAIIAAEPTLTQGEASARFGVAPSTVWKIWREEKERRSASQS